LPDDALRDKVAGESGHMKVWDTAEKVEQELLTAESRYKDDMLGAQESFSDSLSSLASQVDQLAARTELDKVLRSGLAKLLAWAVYRGMTQSSAEMAHRKFTSSACAPCRLKKRTTTPSSCRHS
jgi:hypothetical protein